MKVYVVIHGSYNDQEIVGVLSSKDALVDLYTSNGFDANGVRVEEVTTPIDRTFDPPRRRYRSVGSEYRVEEFTLDDLVTTYRDRGDYGWEYFEEDNADQED